MRRVMETCRLSFSFGWQGLFGLPRFTTITVITKNGQVSPSIFHLNHPLSLPLKRVKGKYVHISDRIGEIPFPSFLKISFPPPRKVNAKAAHSLLSSFSPISVTNAPPTSSVKSLACKLLPRFKNASRLHSRVIALPPHAASSNVSA